VSALSLRTSAHRLLSGWEPTDAAQDALRHTYLAFLDRTSDACLRSSVTGHLTGSVIVFDASLSYVLLTLHPRVGRWLQLGGHCEEADETIHDAAAREAWEESGIPDLRVAEMPVRLDTHPITCSLGVPTRHLDVQFAAVTPPTSDGQPPAVTRSDESTDLAWWPADELPAGVGGGVSALVATGIAAVRGVGSS
jgi:8-oxo-dGTP pyrophosphatase MutT (NUDIX family)